MPQSLPLSAGMSLAVGGVLLLVVSWGARELRGFSLRDVSTASAAALAGEPLSATVVFAGLVIAAGVAPALARPSRLEYGGHADA